MIKRLLPPLGIFFTLFFYLGFPLFFPEKSASEASDAIYGWTKTVGGGGNDYGKNITTDSDNNIYTTGRFNLTVDFDPSAGTDNHTSNGGEDFFITKYTSDGTYDWTKTVGGTSADLGYGITPDTNNNIYVSGVFISSPVDFDPSAGTDNHSTNGGYDIFITKYASDGTYQWTKTVGGTSHEYGQNAASDYNNNIYVTGRFSSSTVDFDPSAGTDNHSANGGYDIFITKYASDGTYQWTKTVGGTSNDWAYGITADINNNIYVSGYFQSTVDFDPSGGTDNHTSNGGFDIFITKYASDGTYQWTKTMGSNFSNDVGYSITTDTDNNVYGSGVFKDTVDFDPSVGTDNHTSNGSEDFFITKYASDGTYKWTKTVGGTSGEYGYGITANTNNDTFVTGFFQSTVDFDPSTDTDNHTSNGNFDIFITKYTSDGTYQWTKTMGANSSNDVGYSITTDTDNNVYGTGEFAYTIDFDPSAGTDNHTSNGAYDIFVTKYTDDAAAPSLSLTALSPDPNSNNSPSLFGTATDSLGTVTTVEYQVDSISGSWSSCSADDGTFDETSEDFTCTVSTTLDDGEHTIYFRTNDSNSNTTAAGSYSSDTFTVDTTPPSFPISQIDEITSISPGSTVNIEGPRPTFMGITEPYAHITLTIYSDPIIGEIDADEYGNWNWTPDEDILAGTHRVVVTAGDLAGNESESEFTLTVGLADTGIGINALWLVGVFMVFISMLFAMWFRPSIHSSLT